MLLEQPDNGILAKRRRIVEIMGEIKAVLAYHHEERLP
jgi:hypothetical protein